MGAAILECPLRGTTFRHDARLLEPRTLKTAT
jgi:hypothetical protein